MPDFGQRSPVDLVNGGMQDITNEAQRQDDERKKKEALNRVIHPANEKWIRAIQSGQMSPTEAAVAAHREHDQMGTPHFGQSQFSGPQPQAGGMSQSDGSTPDPTVRSMTIPGDTPDAIKENYPATSLQVQPSRMQAGSADGGVVSPVPQSSGGMQGQRPFTVQDLNDAEGIGKLRPQYRPLQDELAIEKERGKNRGDVATINADGRQNVATTKAGTSIFSTSTKAETADKDRTERGREADNKMQLGRDQIRAINDRLHQMAKDRANAAAQGQIDKLDERRFETEAKQVKDLNDKISAQQIALGEISAKNINPGSDEVQQAQREIRVNIQLMQQKLEDLEASQHDALRSKGMRGNLPDPLGVSPPPGPLQSGASGPAQRPNDPSSGIPLTPTSSQMPQQAMPQQSDQSTPDIPANIPVREPPSGTGPTGQGGPTMPQIQGIQVRDKKTGEVQVISRKVVDSASRHPNFLNQYEIVGVQ